MITLSLTPQQVDELEQLLLDTLYGEWVHDFYPVRVSILFDILTAIENTHASVEEIDEPEVPSGGPDD